MTDQSMEQRHLNSGSSIEESRQHFSEQQFKYLYPYIGIGVPAPKDWQSLANQQPDQQLLIIVGTTGVGKNTITAALAKTGLAFTLLPNRRSLSDILIIEAIASSEGKELKSLGRIERFAYVRQFREKFPGGMAYILRHLHIDPSQVSPLLMFDGLRGQDEILYAVKEFPKAKFIVLEAPDYVRLQRLLNRRDPFDRILEHQKHSGAANSSEPTSKVPDSFISSFADLGVSEARSLFTATEEQELLSLVHSGAIAIYNLQDKLRIIVEERRNYDLKLTRLTLEAIASERTLVIDTVTLAPEQAVREILKFI